MGEFAILMAAGLGTRMHPLTNDTPKPLIRVNGTPMIETVIEGLRHRGVDRFYVVTGYLGDQFDYLAGKYTSLKLVRNNDYRTVNNISSIYAVSDELMDSDSPCFICEADLYVSDPSLFEGDFQTSCYFGKMVSGHSDDWVFDTDENGRITRVGKVGDDRYNMVGVSRFLKDDARLLGRLIRNAYGREGYKDLFWDEVVNDNLDKLYLTVHEVKGSQITEIDTVRELADVDDSYRGIIK